MLHDAHTLHCDLDSMIYLANSVSGCPFLLLRGLDHAANGAAARHRKSTEVFFEVLSVWRGADCNHLACYLAAGIRRPSNVSKTHLESDRQRKVMQTGAPRQLS